MKAALYIRVSTEEQLKGMSMDAQTDLLRDYCTREGIEIFKEYSDPGYTSSNENRPAFQQLLSDAEKKLFDIVLVWKFDRFIRKVEMSYRIESILEKLTINIISITEPIENSPMGFFMKGLHRLMSEYEIRLLAERVKMGKTKRASMGLHNGFVCYGYKIDNGKVIIDELRAPIVKLIYQLYSDGYGYTRLQKYLNTSVQTYKEYKWSNFQIWKILTNVSYTGILKYDGQVYQAQWEPIISQEQFDFVQRLISTKGNYASHRGKNYEHFFLLGLLRCEYCSNVFRIHTHTKKTGHKGHYYRCNNTGQAGSFCDFKKYFNAAKLEEVVISDLKAILKLKSMPDNINITDTQDVSELLVQRQKTIQKEMERSKEAYLSSAFTLDEYKELRKKYEDELKQISAEISNTNKHKSQVNLARLKDNITSSLEYIESCTIPQEKRKELQKFLSKITMSRGNIVYHFYI